MVKPLLILGGGTFAVETLDIAEAAGSFEPLGFVVSRDRPEADTRLAGLPVFWVDDMPCSAEACTLVGGIVSPQRRGFVEAMLARGYRFTSVIHPAAVISRRAEVREGCVIHAGVIISSNTLIEPHTILNRGSLIGHDNHIGPFSTIGPGANLAGGVQVGAAAYVGVGAVVRDHLSIGCGSVVGAGAVVVKSVPPYVLVTGVPARVAKTDVRGLV